MFATAVFIWLYAELVVTGFIGLEINGGLYCGGTFAGSAIYLGWLYGVIWIVSFNLGIYFVLGLP